MKPPPTPGEKTALVATTPRRPTRSFKTLWDWLVRAYKSFSDINGVNWSASFAYYAFFALVPLVLLLVTVSTDLAARFVGERTAKEKVLALVFDNLPMGGEGLKMIGSTLQGVLDARGKIGLVAFAGVLWSSLGFFQSLVGAVNQAWNLEPLNWWKLPLKNLTMVGVLASALLLGNVLPVILKTVQGYVTFASTWTTLFFGLAGALVPPLVLFYGFLLFYKLAPRNRANVTFAMVWLPAMLVTALLVISQQLFVVYTTHITNFNVVYGGFGAVAALMLWIYLSGLIIVFGGCLCSTRKPRGQSSADGSAN